MDYTTISRVEEQIKTAIMDLDFVCGELEDAKCPPDCDEEVQLEIIGLAIESLKTAKSACKAVLNLGHIDKLERLKNEQN